MNPFEGFDLKAFSLTDKEKERLLRRHALHCKYAKAVELYADTDQTLAAIAEACQVSVGGLGNYLRRYWRELVLKRNCIAVEEKQSKDIKIKAVGQQNVNAHAKYKEAVAACDSLEYIDLNLSQVARKFGLDGASLANFMHIHYEDTLVWREKLRTRLGINDNLRRGARRESVEQYAEAVNLYQTTNMTIPEIAEMCHLSEGGLMQYLRFYHKKLLQQKRESRKEAKGCQSRGELTGNGRLYRPLPQTDQKYAEALALYQDTALTMKEIVRRTGVPAEGFRFYLRKWHWELVAERAGITEPIDAHTNLCRERRRMKTVTVKYAEAIESLKANPRPVAQVAAEFHLQPETFRNYLHKYEPELVRLQGMTVADNGRKVLYRSEEKYAEAIRLYDTTTESLKGIAQRLGLNEKSLGGYIRRNYPELVQKRKQLSGK